jgi:hypothetical protein
MLEELEQKSNNEILFDIKQMEADYESIKIRMLKLYDEMEQIEKRFSIANNILVKRLKGE